MNVNDLVTGGDVSVTKPDTTATQGKAQIYLVPTSGDTATFDDPSNDPVNNCNAGTGSGQTVTVTFTQSAVNSSGQSITSPVTLGANSLSFTACDDPTIAGIQNAKELSYTVGTSANVGDKITVQGVATGGRSPGSSTPAYTPDQFVITIVAPPQKGTTLAVDPASGTYDGSADLKATLACPTCATGTDLSGKTIDFTLNGNSVGSATTNSSGVATKSAVSLSGIDAGTYADAVSASYAGTGSGCTTNCFGPSDGKASLTVNQAHATLTLSGLTGHTYNGSPQGATVTTDPAGLNGVSVTYNGSADEPTNAGSYSVVASLNNPNYEADNATGTLVIDQATSTTTVTCTGAPFTYTGLAQTPCSANVTGAGGLNNAVTPVTYSNNVNAGQASASATYGGDANHTGSNGSANFTIGKATLTVTANNATKTLGAANPAFTASYSGFKNNETLATSGVTGEPNLTTTATAASPVGSYPITSAAGNLASDNYSFNFVNGTLKILYAPTMSTCLGSPGHAILQPINPATGTDSVFKQGSTVPAKFRVCDASGNSIGTADVVQSFKLLKSTNGTETIVNEPIVATTPDTAFRWSATDQQWIFNISTKSQKAGFTYYYQITLNDGSTIEFQYGLK